MLHVSCCTFVLLHQSLFGFFSELRRQEFLALCPHGRGLKLLEFTRLVNDESDDGCYCTDKVRGFEKGLGVSECTKIARFSAAAAAIFTAPHNIARFFEAPRCAISFSSAKKIASEPRFLLRRKRVKMVLVAEFLAIPSFAVKIASEWRCAILVHSVKGLGVSEYGWESDWENRWALIRSRS